MSRMNEIYGSFSIGSQQWIQKSESLQRVTAMDSVSLESNNTSSSNQEFQIQSNIRSLFGKHGVTVPAIGGHPDFNYLEKEAKQEHGYAVSLFVDIKGSTKLGVIYTPAEVFWIKNQIIKCAIETVLAFDGHVHRIMGDAVLAFFRGNDISPQDSAINAINCGAYLVEFMKSVVSPKMQTYGVQEDVGIRVGIDYGKHEEVIWGMYGYAGSSEVTATSYHVDVAAKLQQKASKNRVMVGQSLVELLDLHDEVIGYKTSGGGEPERYVTPNYTNRENKAKNYKQFEVNHGKYFDLLPKPEDDALPIKIFAEELKKESGASSQLSKCARSVSKNCGIKFSANFWVLGHGDSKVFVRFRVENHGAQASGFEDFSNHYTLVEAERNISGMYSASHTESAEYLGLHYMYVSAVNEEEQVIHKEQRFPVYIG